jgi:hypothetical protein
MEKCHLKPCGVTTQKNNYSPEEPMYAPAPHNHIHPVLCFSPRQVTVALEPTVCSRSDCLDNSGRRIDVSVKTFKESWRSAAASEFEELATKFRRLADLLLSDEPLFSLTLVTLKAHAAHQAQRLAQVEMRIASWDSGIQEPSRRLTLFNEWCEPEETDAIGSCSTPEAS